MKGDANKQGVDWDTVEDLGKVYDKVLADRFGVSTKEVFRARKARKIPPFTTSKRRIVHPDIDWSKELSGDADSKEIADRLGVSTSTVSYHRQKLGLGKQRKRRQGKTDHIDWPSLPLGEESDRKIAKRLGVAPQTVSIHRRALGIQGRPRTQRPDIDWEAIEGLDITPTSKMAKRLGVSNQTVAYHRRRLGISNPPISKDERYFRSAKTTREAYTSKHHSPAAILTNELTAGMGMTLAQVCRHLGLHQALVSAFRTGKQEPMGPSGFRDTARQFAAFYGLAPEQVWSQYDPVQKVDASVDPDSLVSPYGNPDAVIERAEFRSLYPELAASVLTPRERTILQGRYGEERKILSDIGEALGITRERVRQLEVIAIRKLREAYGLRDERDRDNLKLHHDRPEPKPKKKAAKNELPKPSCHQRVLAFFARFPNHDFQISDVAKRISSEFGHSNNTVRTTIHSLYHYGNLKRVGNGQYRFVTKRRQKTKVNPKPKTAGWQHILNLMNFEPERVFSRKEIQAHLEDLGYATQTVSLYLSRLVIKKQIENTGYGQYRLLPTKDDNEKSL